MTVFEFVNNVRKKYNNIRDFEAIADAENIQLIFLNATEGLINKIGEVTTIIIAKNLPLYQQIEVFWHEYFHLHFSNGNFIGDQACNINSCPNKDENKANKFVAFLLIEDIPPNADIYTLMEDFNVSQDIAEIRLGIR